MGIAFMVSGLTCGLLLRARRDCRRTFRINVRCMAPLPAAGALPSGRLAAGSPVGISGRRHPAIAVADSVPVAGAGFSRDDVRALGVGVRLLVHALAALWFVSPWLATRRAGLSFATVALVLGAAPSRRWSLNLYNFMDGNDGLAAVMAMRWVMALAPSLRMCPPSRFSRSPPPRCHSSSSISRRHA